MIQQDNRTQYDVTVSCANCDAEWQTWGISWHEPTVNDWPGGDWLLGQSYCANCGEEEDVAVKSINNDLEPDTHGHPSLNATERNR